MLLVLAWSGSASLYMEETMLLVLAWSGSARVALGRDHAASGHSRQVKEWTDVEYERELWFTLERDPTKCQAIITRQGEKRQCKKRPLADSQHCHWHDIRHRTRKTDNDIRHNEGRRRLLRQQLEERRRDERQEVLDNRRFALEQQIYFDALRNDGDDDHFKLIAFCFSEKDTDPQTLDIENNTPDDYRRIMCEPAFLQEGWRLRVERARRHHQVLEDNRQTGKYASLKTPFIQSQQCRTLKGLGLFRNLLVKFAIHVKLALQLLAASDSFIKEC
ncbi:hypothetical protein PoB_001219800 [Plakobranchus ocellatus]|uniref:Uncharacterized protein n=1 Tax=Plakobranchus ocellatus TaxID=259542 RepID=A0AAV3YTK0_9GAST|nr:hypothetical protein PoB_001219800 [Plakobranchus ocellatus]